MVLISMMVLGLLVFGALAWGLSAYNALVALKNRVEEAWSGIDVALAQRHDELVKLVEVVKGVRDFEAQTLQKVTEARGAFAAASDPAARLAGGQAEGLALRGLFAVAEAYPQLKADESFRMLQARIGGLEDGLAAGREGYNDAVNAYNTGIARLPEALLAGFLGYRRHEYFRAEESERADVIPRF